MQYPTASQDSNILDLTSQYPIFRSIVEHIGLWDLVQFSRSSTTIRKHCHGFINAVSGLGPETPDTTAIRPFLNIGQHQTATWRLYKSLTIKECCEPDHTRGREPLGCRLCSKPVCFACVVKHSFGKQENTFLLRARALCKQCFRSGNPHSEHILVHGSTQIRVAYAKSGVCQCTSQDGILCSNCKKKQNQDSVHRFKCLCAGVDCHNSIDPNSNAARVCIWCNSVLPTALQKQQYDTRPYLTNGSDTGIATERFQPVNAATEGHGHEQSSAEETDEEENIDAFIPLIRAQTSAPIYSSTQSWPPPDDEVPAYSLHHTDTSLPSPPTQLQT